MFDNMPSSIEFIRGGKLRALGVTTAKRSDQLPTCRPSPKLCPAMKRAHGLAWARPRARRPMRSPDSTARSIGTRRSENESASRRLGGDPIAGTPAEFWKIHAYETEKWAKVVKSSGAKVD